jgi:hypothetical protein
VKSEDLYLFDLPALCRVVDCGRAVSNKRESLCGRHYTRLWRYGDPEAGGPLRPTSVAGQPVEDFPDGTRRCTSCRERMSLSLFHKDAGGTAGRRSHCMECHKAKARAWYAANRERQAAREKARRAANPDRVRQWDMERYARDRDKRIALATQHAHKRRLRLAAAEFDPTVTRANLRKQYGDTCFYCDCAMDFARFKRGETPPNLASIEHVHPISRGGTHTWDNVVLACLRCNLRKNATPADEWLASA